MKIPPSSSGPRKTQGAQKSDGKKAVAATGKAKATSISRTKSGKDVSKSSERLVSEQLRQTLPEAPKGKIPASAQAEAVGKLASEITNTPIVFNSQQLAALKKLKTGMSKEQVDQLSQAMGKKFSAAQFSKGAQVGLSKFVKPNGEPTDKLKQALNDPSSATKNAESVPSDSDPSADAFSLTALLLLLAQLETEQSKTMDKAMMAQKDMVVGAIKDQASKIKTKAIIGFTWSITAALTTLAVTSIAMGGFEGFGAKNKLAFKAQEGMQASSTGQQIGGMLNSIGQLVTGLQESDIKGKEAEQQEATFFQQRDETDEQRRAQQQTQFNSIVDQITQSDVEAKKAAARGMA